MAERELENPEGAGFDLRVGELVPHQRRGISRASPSGRPPRWKWWRTTRRASARSTAIQPGEFLLARTIETVNTPADLTINFKPRTTTFRSGLHIRTGNVAPGYKGPLVFALKNEGPCVVTIEMGARLVHAQFYTVAGDSNLYRGQWQGGRVTTGGVEEQV